MFPLPFRIMGGESCVGFLQVVSVVLHHGDVCALGGVRVMEVQIGEGFWEADPCGATM